MSKQSGLGNECKTWTWKQEETNFVGGEHRYTKWWTAL